ncbi:GNAT family N-acetyltransferase [Acanthopleuribacter pedis]|uniref:GNAT family N-acetyltransferase n=1 Tax=Acanthopleuribacter pedis TaxID=442870 RepID=UPI00311CCE24
MLVEKDGLAFERLTERSFDECIELMASVFSVGEPMTALMGVTEDEFRFFATIFTRKALNEGLPIVARDTQTGALVGFSISEDLGNPEPEEAAHISAKFGPIVGLLDQLVAHFCQSHVLAPGKYVHVFMVGVKPGFKKRSVAFEMMAENMELAKKLGYEAAIGETTSEASARLTEKVGFREVYKINYSEFEFEDRKVFAGLNEACCRLMVRYFSEES